MRSLFVLLLVLVSYWSTAQSKDIFVSSADSIELTRFINNVDTVSYYFDNDIITILPICGSDMVIVVSEISAQPIGVFNYEDTRALLSWIISFPISKDDVKHAQFYYSDIVAEHIYE